MRAGNTSRGTGTYQDNLEQHLLVDLHEFLIPLLDIGRLAAVIVIVTGGGGVVLVVLAPFDDLAEDGLVDLRGISLSGRCCAALALMASVAESTYIGDRDGLAGVTEVLQHVLNQDRSLSDGALCFRSAEVQGGAREATVYIPTVTSVPSELVRVIWGEAIVAGDILVGGDEGSHSDSDSDVWKRVSFARGERAAAGSR